MLKHFHNHLHGKMIRLSLCLCIVICFVCSQIDGRQETSEKVDSTPSLYSHHNNRAYGIKSRDSSPVVGLLSFLLSGLVSQLLSLITSLGGGFIDVSGLQNLLTLITGGDTATESESSFTSGPNGPSDTTESISTSFGRDNPKVF